jgi:formamidopyrimidine-DNA glycosylase
MPELPEVETVRLGLEPALLGQRLTRVEQRRADLRFPFPERFVARLQGQRIERLDRRSKYIIAHLSGGEALIMHLGMTGRFTIVERETRAANPGAFTHAAGGSAKHDHVVFETEAGTLVTYNDARRFGFMDLAESAALQAHPLIRDIGIEPLGEQLTSAFLALAAQGKKADLKAFLMDQRIVCGLGNIYVCETLFRAGLSPFKPSSRIAGRTGRPKPAADVLPAIIRAVLTEALAAGGSSLRDYQKTDGTLGYFQKAFAVYGREGEPCITEGCTAVIARRVQANRSTFFCPQCQMR